MVLRIAHRGACKEHAENSLPAFRRAVEIDVDLIEFDVCQCKTGELVVVHDRRLERQTGAIGAVTNTGFTELRKRELANGEQIPLLDEVLDVINGAIPVIIEVKWWHNPVDAVVNRLQHHIETGPWTENDFIFTSFNPFHVRHAAEAMPHLKTGGSTWGIGVNWGFNATYGMFKRWTSIDVIHFHADFITADHVRKAHQDGFDVYAWTWLQQPDNIPALKAMGVDGIYAFHPEDI